MTAPQQPPPQPVEEAGAGRTVAAAAVGLALLAVESRVRADIEDALVKPFTAWAALVLAVITAGRTRTGTELLSRSDVYTGLRKSLAAVEDAAVKTVRSAYTAGAQLALARTSRDLKKLGHQVPGDLPDLGGAVDVLVADVRTAVGHAQSDVQNTIRDAFDGVTGDNPNPARVLVVDQAIKKAAARLAQRLNAAAAVATYQGSRDAQLALYARFEQVNPYIGLRKRWVVTAVDPCGMCEALHGTTIAVGAEFDHEATTGVLRPVWRNLLGPPRHPNCRCQLELVTA